MHMQKGLVSKFGRLYIALPSSIDTTICAFYLLSLLAFAFLFLLTANYPTKDGETEMFLQPSIGRLVETA